MTLLDHQEVIGPTVDGIDFGVELIVLVRDGDRLLVWEPGHSSYINRMTGSRYFRGSLLVIHRHPDRPGYGRTDLANTSSGGHGYKTLLRDQATFFGALHLGAEAIDAEFGEHTASLLLSRHGRSTLAISGEPYRARVINKRGPTKRQREADMRRKRAAAWQAGKVVRRAYLTKAELERLVDLFADANDPVTRSIADKARAVLAEDQRDADDPWRQSGT